MSPLRPLPGMTSACYDMHPNVSYRFGLDRQHAMRATTTHPKTVSCSQKQDEMAAVSVNTKVNGTV